MEGDRDWYRIESAVAQNVTVTVDTPLYNSASGQNVDPILEVYNADLGRLAYADSLDPGADESRPGDPPRRHGVRTGPQLQRQRRDPGVHRGGEPATSRRRSRAARRPALGSRSTPADSATGVAMSAAPRLTFQRALDPASVTAETVRLVHGRTLATIATTVSYDVDSQSVTLTPAAPLTDNTAYRVVVGAVRDAGEATFTAGFSTTFRTVNTAPAAVGSVNATAGFTTAKLSWTLPAIEDLDQVIVRVAAGSTAPASPTAGTAVYAGRWDQRLGYRPDLGHLHLRRLGEGPRRAAQPGRHGHAGQRIRHQRQGRSHRPH